MAVFRIEKTKNYTVMSNHHLRNSKLSLKSKGLLSQMLSLPENWDYTLKGLSHINRESVEAIRTAVLELEKAGYIVRRQKRDEKGKMSNIEYTIYEQPQQSANPNKQPVSPSCDFSITDKPTSGNPIGRTTKWQMKKRAGRASNTEDTYPKRHILSKPDAVSYAIKNRKRARLLPRCGKVAESLS